MNSIAWMSQPLMVIVSLTAAASLLSGIARFGLRAAETQDFCCALPPTEVQPGAAATAAAASTVPKPKSGWCQSPKFSLQPALVGEFRRAVDARISWTSRQVSEGFACSIRATVPETIGELADVPVKSETYWLFSAVVVIAPLVPSLLEGAQTRTLAPVSPYQGRVPLSSAAHTVICPRLFT